MTDAERIESTRRLLEATVREAGGWISGDGRVGEEVAAELLGLAPGSMCNQRYEHRGPPFYKLGGAGHRVTYRLADLAWWIESRREG